MKKILINTKKQQTYTKREKSDVYKIQEMKNKCYVLYKHNGLSRHKKKCFELSKYSVENPQNMVTSMVTKN